MTDRSKRSVVVTGASTGVGETYVTSLVQAGFFVFGSVPRTADAERLKKRFGDGFVPFLSDSVSLERTCQSATIATCAYRTPAC